MNLKAWNKIACAWEKMAKRIDQALPPPSRGAEVRPVKDKDPAAMLDSLNVDLKASLAELLTELRTLLPPPPRISPESEGSLEAALTEARSAGGDEMAKRPLVYQILVPIAILMDERVLVRLPAALAPRWNRLQRDLIGSDNGGVVFYERLESLINSWSREPILIELYYHCLSDGFSGRCLDEGGRKEIEGYRAKLARLIERPKEPSRREPPAPAKPPALPSRARYWAIAIASLVLIPLAAKLLFS
ncbi:DotU family type IV/VI secretion system protein [Sorangium sp. So ce1099]|uniref:DotU family type IV/VI secretion system protein n=1 Tax=Sorangium sp. So ce1099 TaxID=3133331 RepID=UPI003F5DA157